MATGSFDTNIKLWDYRKKGCILTYKAHAKDVHCLRLSPDGRWLASGGHEVTVIVRIEIFYLFNNHNTFTQHSSSYMT